MAAKEAFFKPAHNVLGGYYIPVINDWNYHIKKQHITEKEKEIYQQEVGEKMLTEDQYFSWWRKNQHLFIKTK